MEEITAILATAQPHEDVVLGVLPVCLLQNLSERSLACHCLAGSKAALEPAAIGTDALCVKVDPRIVLGFGSQSPRIGADDGRLCLLLFTEVILRYPE